MKKMLLSLLMVLVVVGVGLYAFAPHAPATPKQAMNTAELEAYLDRLVASGNPPGVSVVVVRDGEIVYNKAFGFADGPRKIKATPETVYHWWSMTKIPTAVAILQLQEQGKLDLEDDVTDHLPWFEVKDRSGRSPSITIRQLLQHSAGLPDPIPAMIGWVHYANRTYNQTEVLKKYMPEFNTLKFEPGTQAVYSNLNYMVLGAVIEAASGQSYESYIGEHILRPLGMSQTSFVYSPSMADHEAAGTLPVAHMYTPLLPTLLDPAALIRERKGKLLWLNRFSIEATPSTGLIGSAPDAARFMLMVLNHGTLQGQAVLTPGSIALLNDAQAIDGRGLGWAVHEANGERYLEHMGGGAGFATNMRIYPEAGLGIVLLANGTDLDRSRLADLLRSLDW